MTRLAIYFVPTPQSPLAEAAAAWFEDHAGKACESSRLPPRRLPRERCRSLLASPRHYGFHATIQPPFLPAQGVSIDQAAATLERFCARHRPFVLPPLVITFMHTFFCLRPSAPAPAAAALAAEAVETFLPLRQPPDQAEKERRRSAGLTDRQESIMEKWGYPYLMEEYRFHMTLTGKIDTATDIVLLGQDLEEFFPRATRERVEFSSLCLCCEDDGAPLQLLHRFQLGETVGSSFSTERQPS